MAKVTFALFDIEVTLEDDNKPLEELEGAAFGWMKRLIEERIENQDFVYNSGLVPVDDEENPGELGSTPLQESMKTAGMYG